MIKIAICDDDRDSCNFIEETLSCMNDKTIETDIFLSGAKLIRQLEAIPNAYHIYLLDIRMPSPNGIDTASALRRQDKDAVIIFITDYKEYVYDVFEVLPFRFLRKPVVAEQLSQAVADAISHIRMFGQIFFFRIGHEKYQLHYREIHYFEGNGRKVRIHTEDNTYEAYERISGILSCLDNSLFCQTHASYIVNMALIRSIKKTEIILEDGTLLPISRRYLNAVKQSHLNFMERRC